MAPSQATPPTPPSPVRWLPAPCKRPWMTLQATENERGQAGAQPKRVEVAVSPALAEAHSARASSTAKKAVFMVRRDLSGGLARVSNGIRMLSAESGGPTFCWDS